MVLGLFQVIRPYPSSLYLVDAMVKFSWSVHVLRQKVRPKCKGDRALSVMVFTWAGWWATVAVDGLDEFAWCRFGGSAASSSRLGCRRSRSLPFILICSLLPCHQSLFPSTWRPAEQQICTTIIWIVPWSLLSITNTSCTTVEFSSFVHFPPNGTAIKKVKVQYRNLKIWISKFLEWSIGTTIKL